jgi:hypothetical protein
MDNLDHTCDAGEKNNKIHEEEARKMQEETDVTQTRQRISNAISNGSHTSQRTRKSISTGLHCQSSYADIPVLGLVVASRTEEERTLDSAALSRVLETLRNNILTEKAADNSSTSATENEELMKSDVAKAYMKAKAHMEALESTTWASEEERLTKRTKSIARVVKANMEANKREPRLDDRPMDLRYYNMYQRILRNTNSLYTYMGTSFHQRFFMEGKVLGCRSCMTDDKAY